MEIPKEKPEPSKKSIVVIFVFLALVVISCLITENLRLRRILVACLAFVAIVIALIDFLWDFLPTKARKERVVSEIQGVYYWLQNYGYQFENSFYLNHNIQVEYSAENLPSVSIFWNNKEKSIALCLFGKELDEQSAEWLNIRYIGKEWYGIDWQSDEFCELTFEQYCEKVFSALGIKRCDESDEEPMCYSF